MTDLREALRSHARTIDDRFEAFDPAELRARAEREAPPDEPGAPAILDVVDPLPTDGPGRSGSMRWLAAAAALVLVLVASAVVVRARDRAPATIEGPVAELPAGEDPTTDLTTVDAPDPGPLVDVAWQEVPPLAIEPMTTTFPEVEGRHTIWTGTEVLLFSGARSQNTLWSIPAYHPSTGTWRRLPAPPQPMQGFATVWTGTRLLAFGNAPGAPADMRMAVALDPSTGTWTSIAAPPERSAIKTLVWAGNRVLAWAMPGGVLAYDPAADRWETLTADHPPEATFETVHGATAVESAWNGSELVLVGERPELNAAFDPATHRWRKLPPTPGTFYRPLNLEGSRAIVGNGSRVSMLDASQTTPSWTQHLGFDVWASHPDSAVVVIGDDLFSWGGQVIEIKDMGLNNTVSAPTDPTAVVHLDLRTGRWDRRAPLPAGVPTPTNAVVAGESVFSWTIENVGGSSTIRALSVPIAALLDDRNALPLLPTDTITTPPANVDRSELVIDYAWGVSTKDGTALGTVTPYLPADQPATVISSDAARARVESDPSTGIAWTGSFLWASPKFGHWQPAGAAPTNGSPLVWALDWVVEVGVNQQAMVRAVIDARTGAVLELAIPPKP